MRKTPVRKKLHSIPPANRGVGVRISSMRAATQTGMVFVGQQHRSPETEQGYEPTVVAPDKNVERQREAWYKARAVKIKQLENLIEKAIDATEINIWRGHLENLKNSGG